MGCDAFKFRESSWFSEDVDEQGRPIDHIKVYPDILRDGRKEISTSHVPSTIKLIYSETIKAFNFNACILTAGGLRAIVEAICLDQDVKGDNLANKIDRLKSKGFLTAAQADLLHEERYIGNRALHEIESPKVADLRDGLDIIDGLLNAIYVLPHKAARLKQSRELK